MIKVDRWRKRKKQRKEDREADEGKNKAEDDSEDNTEDEDDEVYSSISEPSKAEGQRRSKKVNTSSLLFLHLPYPLHRYQAVDRNCPVLFKAV